MTEDLASTDRVSSALTDDEFCMSDTELALITISTSLSKLGIKGVLSKQIQSLIQNRTFIQQSLGELRMSSKYKFLSLKFMGIDDDFIISTDDYVKSTDQFADSCKEKAAIAKFKGFVVKSTNKSIFRKELIKDHDIESDDVDFLTQIGLLRPRREGANAGDEIFWLSHPSVNIFYQFITILFDNTSMIS